MTFRYQRLECDDSAELPFIVKSLQEDLPILGGILTGQREGSIDGWLIYDLHNCIDIACIKHVEYESPFYDIASYLKKGAWIAFEYFWGNWRDGYQPCPKIVHHPFSGEPFEIPEANRPCYSREDCRNQLSWDDEFIDGLLCAFWTNDLINITKISQWVDSDLIEDSYFESHIMDAWILIILGKLIHKKTLSGSEFILDKIRNNKRRRTKLLLDIIQVIDQKNHKDFSKVIINYIKFFVKNETDPTLPLRFGYMSKIASLLWETARYFEIELPILSEEIMDRIITRESIGLITPTTTGEI
jgi:hypothetical protein